MNMSKNRKNCAADTLPKRLLDWGTSQLQKIEKEIKRKKTDFENENYSELTKETKHSCSKKKKQTVVFEEVSEEKQKRRYYTRSRSNSKNIDSECEKLEMSETNVVKHKSKKKKTDKCELVSVNIELKKGDRSYKTNISDTKIKLSKKRKDEDNDNEEKIICVKKKKKNSLLEADENINNEESYLIGIKVTKLDDTCIKETGNKDLKSKSKKRKKIDIYSSDSKKQEEIVEMGENELSPRKKKKKKKKHKDKNNESGASKEESNLEISDTNEFTCKKKRKNKKMRDNYSAEHVEKNILSDVNQMENDVNKEISVYTKKEKGKKIICLENEEDQSITVHKKKKKSKENTNHSELDTHLEVDLVSETDLNTSSCVQSQKKKKKKKNIDVTEEISSEIYIKKKKKKRKKDTESLDDGVCSVSCSSISSYKTDGTGKSGINFGKSPISRLLSNQDLCSSCCGVNSKCSKICSNSSKNSTGTDTNSRANKQEESNDTQLDAIQNSSVICKQNKFDIEVQNYLPANITIKQEKIDEPEHPADICKEMTTLSENVQVEQEVPVCDIPTNHGENVNLLNATIKQEKIDEPELPADICKERTTHENVQVKQEICDISTNHGEIFGNISNSNVIYNGNGTHEIENVGNNNISNILTSSNNINAETGDNINYKNCCLNKIQDKQIHWDSNKQYFQDACETYYNFCDDKLTLHDEIDVCSEIQNQNNSLGEIEVEKTNSVVNNEDILQGKKSHHVSCEANNSHPHQNANTTNSVINGEEMLGEICHNNYSMIKIENNTVSHCVITNAEGVIEESTSLGNISSSDKDQYNQSDSGMNTRTFHQENNQLHVTVHQNLNKLQSYQHYQSTTESEGCQLQSGQQYQGLIENERPQHFNKFRSNQNCQNPTKIECRNQQIELKHEIHKKSSQSSHSSHKSKYDESQSDSAIQSLHFSCVRPPLKNKEHASRLLKVDSSQVELCYYRMCSKSYQDIHVKFSERKQFEMVVRYYADKIRCKSWHIKHNKQKESVQKKK